MTVWKRLMVPMLLAMFAACVPASFGTGPASSTPPPPLAGTHPPRWEYYCVNAGWQQLDMVLKAAGVNGWELVTSDGTEHCFKRPWAEAAAASAQAPAAPAAPAAN